MQTSLIVVDDFYNDAPDVRQLALHSDFGVRGNFPGQRTGPYLHEGIKDAIQRLVQVPIVYWPEDNYNGAFQYNTISDKTWVHSDHTTNFAGVLFLTPDPPPESGTCFFKHLETGCESASVDRAQQAACERDAADCEKWRRIESVANRFNRLVLFDSNRFHSSDSYFGLDKFDGRLFQAFFFSVYNNQIDNGGA